MNYKLKLTSLELKRKALTNSIRETIPLAFPVGSMVHFFKWRKNISAEVIQTSEFGEQIKVRSHTGNEYWIDVFWLQRT
jgi:hypothetical protein